MQGYTVISQLSELAAFGKFTILVENCERKGNLRVGKGCVFLTATGYTPGIFVFLGQSKIQVSFEDHTVKESTQ